MKKIVLLISLATFFCMTKVNGQSKFQHEALAFLPVGDSSDISSFGLGINSAYLFDVSDKFKIGPSVGYNLFIGNIISITDGVNTVETDLGEFHFLPVTAVAKYNFTDKISLRADIGYAFGLDKDNEGGIYFSPKLGYEISDAIGVKFGYIRMTDSSDQDLHFNALSLGIGYTF